MKIDSFLTGHTHKDARKYLVEKKGIFDGLDPEWHQCMELGAQALEAVTSWRAEKDSPFVLIEMCAAAVVLDTGKSSDAVGLAIRKLGAVGSRSDDQATAFEHIILLDVHLRNNTELKTDAWYLKDIFQSNAPLSVETMSGVSAILLKQEKRIQLASVIKNIFITHKSRGWESKMLTEFSRCLIDELPLDILSDGLPKLSSEEEYNKNAIAWFLKDIFNRPLPALLILVTPNDDQRWIIKTSSFDRTDYSQNELNELILREGQILSDYPIGQANYSEEDFFDRIASAHKNSLNWIRTRRNNVFELDVRVNAAKGGEG